MPFWMRESHVKTRLRMVPWRRRVLLSGVALLLVVGCMYFAFIHPKKTAHVDNANKINKLSNTLTEFTTLQKQHQELKAACTDLKHTCAQYGQELLDQNACTEALFKAIKKTNLTCHRFTPNNEHEDNNVLNLVLRGSYANMMAFFSYLSEQSLPMVVTTFAMQAVAHNQVQMAISVEAGEW